MSDDKAEVRVSLVADDLASQVVKGVVEGMRQAHEEAEKTSKAMGGGGESLVGSVLKANVEFAALKAGAELVTATIHESYEAMEMLADAALEAADAQDRQQRAMAGSLFLMDQGKHAMGDLRDYAADTREEFAGFGMEVGVSTKSITEAYDALIARGTMGSEAAKDLAMQMAVVGKVVPGGMQSLADGFSMIEMGMVRARNPVVQLIAATHTLRGNAHEVAAAMMKMTPEKQMELAQRAIEAQGKALGPAGQALGAPNMDELKTSFEGVKEGFLESMGQPIEDALIPHLVALRGYLIAHIEEIKRFGQEVGDDVGHVVDYVSNVVEGIHEGIEQDWGEIKDTFDSILGDWAAAWGNARKDTAGIRTEFRTLTDDFVLVMKPILAGIKATAEVAMDANDLVHGRAAGTSQMNVQAAAAREQALNTTDAPGSLGKTEQAILKYRQLAEMAGVGADAAEQYAAALRDQATANGAASDKAREALDRGDDEGFSQYLDSALKTQSDGAQQFAFSLLEKSEDARKALVAGGIHVAGGLDELMKVIEDKAPELAEQLNKLRGGVGKEGIKPPASINFHGASFTLKQDFKDQDPDRIVAVFKRDVSRAATSRIESRLSQPFGL
jgi:hypothetical protein